MAYKYGSMIQIHKDKTQKGMKYKAFEENANKIPLKEVKMFCITSNILKS